MNTSPKAHLRQHYISLRQNLSQEERTLASQKIYERLWELPSWQNAGTLCAYMSIRGEIDTIPIIKEAYAVGKSIALPRTTTGAQEGQMDFCRVPHLTEEHLTVGRFGISEPSASCQSLMPSDLSDALILLPGLAFDQEGYRIGYGGGYYDRYIAHLLSQGVRFTTVALAFSPFVADKLPHDPHDMPAHIIVTERRVYHPHGQF